MKIRAKRARANGNGGVGVYDMLAAPWTEAGKDGIVQKVVRVDHAKGHYLGLVAFDQLVASGLHQHLGVATSYVVQGSLSDYAGDILRGQMGINLKGATHDAVAYEKCLLVARLEGPVVYPPHDGPLHRLHAGARHSAIVNAAPEVMPDINVTVDALPLSTTALAGVSRRMIFDYKGTGDDRRLVQLQVLPGARIPAHRTSAVVEWFVLGGDVSVGNRHARGGSFVCIDPDAQVTLSSAYGALMLAWAEGPIEWSDGKPRPDLYGF
ncbi:MAG: anti-sigma factor [Alphaproteobacteria bacterium]|nr:anti-sigma factor [Alphaproteobacteria bacterium]MBV8408263.1 anti-sigma factor [Alphaproteobacteria bacterium]